MNIQNESKLPSFFEKTEWYLLAPWSNLKHPKKWMHSRRLQKKFCKNRYKYLPFCILDRYGTITENLLKDKYDEAMKEIMAEEDKHLKSY